MANFRTVLALSKHFIAFPEIVNTKEDVLSSLWSHAKVGTWVPFSFRNAVLFFLPFLSRFHFYALIPSGLWILFFFFCPLLSSFFLPTLQHLVWVCNVFCVSLRPSPQWHVCVFVSFQNYFSGTHTTIPIPLLPFRRNPHDALTSPSLSYSSRHLAPRFPPRPFPCSVLVGGIEESILFCFMPSCCYWVLSDDGRAYPDPRDPLGMLSWVWRLAHVDTDHSVHPTDALRVMTLLLSRNIGSCCLGRVPVCQLPQSLRFPPEKNSPLKPILI